MSDIGLNRPFRVFISHGVEDMNLVKTFADILTWNNAYPLVAEYQPDLGKLLWKEKIKRLINECNYFVVLYTYTAQNKPKVHQEIGSAGMKDKRIIVLLQDGIDRKDLPGFLEGLEIVENFNMVNPFWGLNEVTRFLLWNWYRVITKFYGYEEPYGKILFKFDELSNVWNKYKYDPLNGNWQLIHQ